MSTIVMFIIVGLLLVVMVVLPMFTNKKRQQAVQEMHSRITVGTKIKTVGGIVGTIIQINEINSLEKEFVLETGLDGSKCTMVFDFNAIYQVMSDLTPVEAENTVEAEEVTETAEETTEEKAE